MTVARIVECCKDEKERRMYTCIAGAAKLENVINVCEFTYRAERHLEVPMSTQVLLVETGWSDFPFGFYYDSKT